MSIDITPKSKVGPLEVTYDDVKYILPGRVPVAILTEQNNVPRPKVMAGEQLEKYEEQVGLAILGVFINQVVPDDFRAALALEDVEPVFTAWKEHTGLGKPSSSNA